MSRIFHKKRGTPYHIENSLRGIRRAARAKIGRGSRRRPRYDEIDLDVQMTKDGVIVNTHWARPLLHDGFRDPQRKIGRFTKVSDMTWPEVKRLVAKNGYRINTLEGALRQCARTGIGARIEPKGDSRFEDVELWRGVKAYADKVGARVKGYSIRNVGGRGAGVRRMAAMNAAGIPGPTIH